MAIQKQYIVVGFGYSKEDGTPYSRCAELKLHKDVNNPKWGYVDMKSCIYLDSIKSIGSIVLSETNIID